MKAEKLIEILKKCPKAEVMVKASKGKNQFVRLATVINNKDDDGTVLFVCLLNESDSETEFNDLGVPSYISIGYDNNGVLQ